MNRKGLSLEDIKNLYVKRNLSKNNTSIDKKITSTIVEKFRVESNKNSRLEKSKNIKNSIFIEKLKQKIKQEPKQEPELKQEPKQEPKQELKQEPNKHSSDQTPDWFFTKSDKIDVSIIVPLFKSASVIKSQIDNWPIYNDGLTKEIIYVDDRCPMESHRQVIRSWEEKIPDIGIGAIVNNTLNCGYGKACNIGSKYAKGKYLIFLNADCIVYDNWILPMIELLHDQSIGIVGNMQFKNNKIESAGSQWSWKTKSFLHIGKNIYNGEILQEQMTMNNAKEDIFQIQEREMVTGCCFAIRNDLFYDLGGFDENYKVGYWEDADLCLRVREAGCKVFYQPNSRIYHEVSHTKSVGHKYKNENYNFFEKRWISTGRIDKFVESKRENPPICSIKNNIDGKVVGCVIACNEEEFLEASVNSISPMVDEWIFVIGGNEYAYQSKMCDHLGYPNDKTLEIAYRLANKYGGIVIEPPNRLWQDKVEMRNQYAQRLNQGDWMFMLDGDEVYKPNQLWRLTELMKSHECLILQFWTFWNNINTIGTGKWDKYPQERLIKWKEGYRYSGKNHLYVSNGEDKLVRECVNTYRGEERLFYHYSWVRPLEKIMQKREYYKIQANKSEDDYVERIFLRWRELPDFVTYTHPFGQGGWETFKGIHPKEVQDLIDAGLLNF